MRIGLNFSHQTRLNHFSRLGHEFYIPASQAQWNEMAEEDYLEYFSKVPENLHFDETVEDPDVVVKGEDADIHLIQNLGGKFKRNAINAYLTESSLAISPPRGNNWVLVGKGVDTERFSRWEGDMDGPVITTGNNIGKRTHVFDTDSVDKVRKVYGDDFKAYGRGVGCDEFVPNERLHEVLREGSVYVNFAVGSMAPYALVEAMSVGMPIISLPGPTVRDFITTGYNGVIVKDVLWALKKIFDRDEELNERMGENARRTALGKYDVEEKLLKWNALFKIAAGE